MAELWWIMLGGAVAILGLVLAVALYALRERHGLRDISARRVLVGWGLVFPLVTLALLMGFAFLRGEQLFARS
ncbi:MAG TPA: cytochrome-c oxidase, partial [Erythrobacter sp.]|nr:cytochrome-c oxidase [Erythrobacter sp.]